MIKRIHNFGRINFINCAAAKGIARVVITGIKTLPTEISEPLFISKGRRNGSKRAIDTLFNKSENVTNSTFSFFRLIITGAAMAVGAIAVTKAVSASIWLNGFRNKYDCTENNEMTFSDNFLVYLHI